MSSPAPSRRAFLQVMASSTGALLLGVSCHYDPKTVAHMGRTGKFRPNAYLEISRDNTVTFYLDRVEMGQGTATSHTALLAEELEVEPSKINIEHAPASRDYDLPLMDLGFQITGGSASVRTSWTPLRKAGATAREMLKAAAAQEWEVEKSEIVAQDGTLTHPPSGKKATYGQMAARAARMPVPDPDLKPASALKWVGKSLRRLDAPGKVTGRSVFGIDVQVPNMLTAVVVRSPVLGGTLKSFKGDAAKASPGVTHVVQIPNGVAVVAKTYWEARTAAKKLETEWNEGALANVTSSTLRERFAARSKDDGLAIEKKGNVEDAWKTGKVIEAVYEVPYLAHATMEPMNATAHVSAGKCEVWAPIQSPGLAMEEAIRCTGLPREAIQIHTTHVGGAFGRRSMTDFIAEAIHVSKATGTPVKVVWSREDDIRNDYYRPATYNVLKGAIDSKGNITGWFHRIVAQSVAAQVTDEFVQALGPSNMPQSMRAMLGRTAAGLYEKNSLPDLGIVDGARDFGYAIPNIRVEHTNFDLPLQCGFWRAVGHSENVFIVEHFVDELARMGGIDPLQMRRQLAAETPQLLGVINRVAKEAGWENPLPKGMYRGIAACKAFGSFIAEVAEVSVEPTLRVHRVVAAIDCGTVVNPDLVKAQVESAIVFGLGAALRQRITLKNGRVEQSNFHDFEPVRMFESPKIEVYIIPSEAGPQGAGEPGLPPIAPAVANAILAATGKPVRSMPFDLAMRAQSGKAAL
ncbi:MAG: xanthine dehydrogenase family protein molybdopterin-binding subunit [Polyangiaceae bacterium]|nr:xanthine dehydrogenase family protein molybdopterin-binding subunit [Polyangiaceae bacterium]